jgi:iron complex transport system substrate-binding protein
MNLSRSFLVLAAALFLFPALLFGASQPESTATTVSAPAAVPDGPDHFPQKVEAVYSSAFSIEYHLNYKIVTVTKPWPGSNSGFTYLLVQRGTDVPANVMADQTVEIPVTSIVTMSTTYLSCLEELGLLDTLIGHETFAWVSSDAVNKRIDAGLMKEVGSGQAVNVELLLDMEPDLIMAYGMGSEWDTHPKLEEAKLPYVINAEWNEASPLSRAEWIKYVSVFYNKEGEANAFFDNVVEEYTALSKMAASITDKPSVFAGTPYQGSWWMSGGGSFAAQFYNDSGAAYVWADDESTGSLMLDIETVYEKAGDADFWLNTGYWNSLDEAKAADERFTKFKAYETGMMFNNNLRIGPGGGSDYFESAPINPNKVLADLFKIFHPELLPDHQLYYYRKLN